MWNYKQVWYLPCLACFFLSFTFLGFTDTSLACMVNGENIFELSYRYVSKIKHD